MDFIGYIGMVMAMVGTYINAKADRRCFLIWFVSNGIFIITSAMAGLWPQVGLFVFNTIMCVKGWYTWGKQRKENVNV